MISNDDDNTDGNNTGNNGSTSTVRVGSRRLQLYPLVTVCLGLLNTILILTAIVIGIYCGKVSEEATPHQITAHALILEVKQMQKMQNEAIKDKEEIQHTIETELKNHQQLKLQLEQIKALSDGVQKKIETLKLKKDTLKTNSSDILKSCGRCQSGWFLFKTSCYFHSVSPPLKSWSDSRADCIRRGADLAVINNLEKQVHFFEYLPKLDPNTQRWWSQPLGSQQWGIWIGLTAFPEKHTWLWVNNVTLQHGGYWLHGEPSSPQYRHGNPDDEDDRMRTDEENQMMRTENEDCVQILNIGYPTFTWSDANCHANKQWLCEMEPN